MPTFMDVVTDERGRVTVPHLHDAEIVAFVLDEHRDLKLLLTDEGKRLSIHFTGLRNLRLDNFWRQNVIFEALCFAANDVDHEWHRHNFENAAETDEHLKAQLEFDPDSSETLITVFDASVGARGVVASKRVQWTNSWD